MNSRTLRRLAADHASLHNSPLPPNYLFPVDPTTSDDLTTLDILLAGPQHTPFSAGVFKLHLSIPPNYPSAPPTAFFRTPILHPNVDPQTGGVCVETLKRDWDNKLTIRDVLITISCLLIQPNADSALNAEAGQLIQEGFDAFARRAELMTSIQAQVPASLKEAVEEAQTRGQEKEDHREQRTYAQEDVPAAPARRRRTTARQRGVATRRSDGSPSGGVARRRYAPTESSSAFVVETGHDDVFGGEVTAQAHASFGDEDSSMIDADQENDEARSISKGKMPVSGPGTPRRPAGPPVPLGELTMDTVSSDTDDSAEEEYPPSPRKSPSKRPIARSFRTRFPDDSSRAESSHHAAAEHGRNITPASNTFFRPLASDSPFAPTISPRKAFATLAPQNGERKSAPLFPSLATPQERSGVVKNKITSSVENKRRREMLDAKLWHACGHDVRRWNQGDFDGEVFARKAARW